MKLEGVSLIKENMTFKKNHKMYFIFNSTLHHHTTFQMDFTQENSLLCEAE